MPQQPDLTIPVAGGEPAAEPANEHLVSCVITGCPWTLDTTPPADVPPELLEDMFGHGGMAAVALANHRAILERDFAEHMGTHTTYELVAEINQLRSLCIGLASQSAEIATAYRAATDARRTANAEG